MRFRRLHIRMQTSDGPYGATLDFPDGLVVVWADNSMGKSTCVRSILVALGMEAMLSPSQADLPLPPAMKSRLQSGEREHNVLESEVFLEIENTHKQRIVVQRTIKGARDKNLITVHEGAALTSPGMAAVATHDFFVNRAGAATREVGFHSFLANFFGWSLPIVPTYDGKEYPLYLQCLIPYFIVEQTRGWSTVQPPLPTQFRIRDVHKRAVEFILSLDAHRIALRRQELQFQKSHIEADWSAQVGRAMDVAAQVGGTVQGLPQHPISMWPPQVRPLVALPEQEKWSSIEKRINDHVDELTVLVKQEIPRVEEVAASAQLELTQVEQNVRERQTLLARLLDACEMEQQEVKRVEERLQAIDEDIQRNKDVRTLRTLGSRQDSSLDRGTCPVCHQAVHDSLVPLAAEQAVMSLDDNIAFLTEQRRTYAVVGANARQVAESRSLQIAALRNELSSLRETVRALRQTLVSDGRLPSVAAIRSRIELESKVKQYQQAREQFDGVLAGFEVLSGQWRALQENLHQLPKDDVSDADRKKLTDWADSVKEQLKEYGFGSFAPDQAKISPDTYRPEHDGFDLQSSISASDLIRTIWSYLTGLLELSRTEATNHPGCLIFDEPRQQSAREVSFGALLKRVCSSKESGQQVIFFTSENPDRLREYLSGLPHELKAIQGRVLRKL